MNVVGWSSSGRCPFKKGKKNKRVQSAGASKSVQTKKSKADQNQAECFYCKKLDHWKGNCLQCIASLDPNRSNKRKKQAVADQDNYMIILCNFFICDTTICILDSESLINICNLL